METLEDGKYGLMAAINEGRYAMAPIPDSEAGPTQGGYLVDVQHRALSPELRPEDRAADLPDAAVVSDEIPMRGSMGAGNWPS